MVEELYHQVTIQSERDEKSQILTQNKSQLPAVVKSNNDLFKIGKATLQASEYGTYRRIWD